MTSRCQGFFPPLTPSREKPWEQGWQDLWQLTCFTFKIAFLRQSKFLLQRQSWHNEVKDPLPVRIWFVYIDTWPATTRVLPRGRKREDPGNEVGLDRLLEVTWVTSHPYSAQILIYAVVVHSELDFNGASKRLNNSNCSNENIGDVKRGLHRKALRLASVHSRDFLMELATKIKFVTQSMKY